MPARWALVVPGIPATPEPAHALITVDDTDTACEEESSFNAAVHAKGVFESATLDEFIEAVISQYDETVFLLDQFGDVLDSAAAEEGDDDEQLEQDIDFFTDVEHVLATMTDNSSGKTRFAMAPKDAAHTLGQIQRDIAARGGNRSHFKSNFNRKPQRFGSKPQRFGGGGSNDGARYSKPPDKSRFGRYNHSNLGRYSQSKSPSGNFQGIKSRTPFRGKPSFNSEGFWAQRSGSTVARQQPWQRSSAPQGQRPNRFGQSSRFGQRGTRFQSPNLKDVKSLLTEAHHILDSSGAPDETKLSVDKAIEQLHVSIEGEDSSSSTDAERDRVMSEVVKHAIDKIIDPKPGDANHQKGIAELHSNLIEALRQSSFMTTDDDATQGLNDVLEHNRGVPLGDLTNANLSQRNVRHLAEAGAVPPPRPPSPRSDGEDAYVPGSWGAQVRSELADMPNVVVYTANADKTSQWNSEPMTSQYA